MVSAIIPARNEEASIARSVESVAAQPEIGEVIVVNDQSTDRTGEILADLSSRISKLRVLRTDALPPGWTGKNYALSLGASRATGDWLLFTDADTFHLPGSTACALADAKEHEAALVSYSPEQELETFWERALVPVVYCSLAQRYSYSRINDPTLPDAAANGQFLLIRRDVYESIGGHTAVAPQILEDVALAEMVKNAGNSIYFGAPVDVVRARMYRSFQGMWEGWTKNLYLLFQDGPPGSYMRTLPLVLVGVGLAFALMLWTKSVVLAAIFGSLGSLVAWHVWYALALRRNHFSLKYIQYGFLGTWLFLLAWTVSSWKNTRGTITWKGRTYAARSS